MPDSHQTEVFEMFDATLEVVSDFNHVYALEGLHERSVVRYDYSYSPASREVLLDANFFGPDGRIEDITLERLASSTRALHVLHTHGLARVPLDGGDPAIVYTFDADDPPERPRCCLNAVYTRPSECDRAFGDFDADGVIRLCDKCPDTPVYSLVDDIVRTSSLTQGNKSSSRLPCPVFQPPECLRRAACPGAATPPTDQWDNSPPPR